jgi:putative acetyltransferase
MPGLVPGIHVFWYVRREKTWMAGQAHDEMLGSSALKASFILRPYAHADEDAAIELWRRTWQQHYPHLDFTARLAWWRERWRQELIPVAHVVVAEIDVPSPSPLIPAQAGIQSTENTAPGPPLTRERTEKVLAGFVTVDTKTMYLDQFVVAPEFWGSEVGKILIDEAKRLSPRGLDLLVNKDNARAIRFYEKHGFVYAGEDKNPVSGIAVNRMEWRALSASS